MQRAPGNVGGLGSVTQQHDGFPFLASPMASPIKETTFHTPPPHERSNSLFGPNAEDALDRHREDQESFAAKRETLVSALEGSTGLVKGLLKFNQDKWTIHHPDQLGLAAAGSRAAPSAPAPGPSTSKKALSQSAVAKTLRRAATSYGEERASDDTPIRPAVTRAFTSKREMSASETRVESPADSLSIFKLDLKLGHTQLPNSTLPSLLETLSLSALSQLLCRQLSDSLVHLTQLKTRVLDTSSRILITGDLNAGKSTLVNALLRRDIMPSDQQPCTSVFCEVLDAESYNGGKQEIHAITNLDKYDAADPSTYTRFELDEVEKVQLDSSTPVEEGGSGIEYQLLKAYVTDQRSPKSIEEPNESFIRNGLVSISLIDAPGLNRDTLSTTALFARQSEIDVIVFVVSAENHFTLSAKEFLWNASREKAYVFIVVNKWEGIRDKKRCERLVGEQIKQLSPGTWEHREELVHYVDAAKAIDVKDGEDGDKEWTRLEQSLRSFVLLKRSKSKLAPAKHYLLNLLHELVLLGEVNIAAAEKEIDEATAKLEIVKPIHERLKGSRDAVERDVDTVEESVVAGVKARSWDRLEKALDNVSDGKLEMPAFPGLMGLWSWASEVKATYVRALEGEIREAEEDARSATVDGVNAVMKDLGKRYLPATPEGEQMPDREFRREVMFAQRRRGLGSLAARGVSTGLGLGAATALGLGIDWTATDFEVSFLDLFDLDRVYALAGHGHSNARRKRKTVEDEETFETGTALVSLGLGGVGMIGSRVIGVKGALDSILRVFEVLGSKEAREWAAPVAAALTIAVGAYLVYDLPRALPRNIGRKLELSLSASSASSPTATFASAHSDRIARETRKVLRIAGWDLRERFRAALEKSEKERKEVEDALQRAEGAIGWLDTFVGQVKSEKEKVVVVDL